MVATVLNRALELEPDRLVRGSMYSSDVSSLSSSSALVVEVWHFITITKRIKDMFLKARGKAMFFKVKMIVEWMIGLLIAAMLSIQYSGQCAHVLICSSCPLSWLPISRWCFIPIKVRLYFQVVVFPSTINGYFSYRSWWNVLSSYCERTYAYDMASFPIPLVYVHVEGMAPRL